MKRYLFSSLAIVTSVIAFSFTMPEKVRRTGFDFRFTGNVTSQASIENEANWVQFFGAPQCDAVYQKACELLNIPESFTEVINGVRKMKNDVDIRSTLASGLTTRYVYFVAPIGVLYNNNSVF
jgi:hypothetical protein